LRYKAESLLSVIDQLVHCFSRSTSVQVCKLLAGQLPWRCFGCLSVSTSSPEELQTAAKTLVDSYTKWAPQFNCWRVTLPRLLIIFKEDEPGDISTELFCTIWFLIRACRTFLQMLWSC